MKVLVDTSVWSLALRRVRKPVVAIEAQELARLIKDGNVAMIGPIRQELLSGIQEAPQFERLRAKLAAFPDAALVAGDYETAAMFFNRCRAKGVHGSNTDFLMCAVAARTAMPILTTDGDFTLFRKHLPIVLHKARDVHISNIGSR